MTCWPCNPLGGCSRKKFVADVAQEAAIPKSETMELIRGSHNLRPHHRGCVLTIGNFDGLHLGHQAIIDQLAASAEVHAVPSLVMSFEPHPREFFVHDAAPPPRLSRLRDKVLSLRQMPVDRLLLLSFNRRLAAMTATDFIQQLLVDKLAIRSLVVGDDFRFGARRQGDLEMLIAAGKRCGFDVQPMASYLLAGSRVSSTRVRQALEDGALDEASRLLGRPYRISGRVVQGDQRGRTLGFPTANIHWPLHWQGQPTGLPLRGVYVAWVREQESQVWPAVVNVGHRPTVGGGYCRLEAHLLDFDGDLYGRHLSIDFLHRLRAEQRFSGLDELRQQITCDCADARRFLATQAD